MNDEKFKKVAVILRFICGILAIVAIILSGIPGLATVVVGVVGAVIWVLAAASMLFEWLREKVNPVNLCICSIMISAGVYLVFRYFFP